MKGIQCVAKYLGGPVDGLIARGVTDLYLDCKERRTHLMHTNNHSDPITEDYIIYLTEKKNRFCIAF